MLLTIPFPGFYDTHLSDGIDREEESAAEYMVEEGENYECTAAEIQEAMYFVTDYKKAHQYLAKEYAEQFAEYVLPYKLEFESMTSPREYNFTTDRVFMTISYLDFECMVDATDRMILADIIREQFTSRSGFASYYSNSLLDWLDKPLDEWDHNEAGTVLLAYLQTKGIDLVETEKDILDYMFEGNSFGEALDQAMDKDALIERLKQMETA